MIKTKSIILGLLMTVCIGLGSLSNLSYATVDWTSMPIWFKTNTGITTVNGKVSEWVGSSTQNPGWKLTHWNPNVRPDLITNALNGYPVIRMDGTDQFEQKEANGNISYFNFMSNRVYDNYHVFYAGSITPHNNESHCLYRAFYSDDYYKFDIGLSRYNGGELSMMKSNLYQSMNFATDIRINQSNPNFAYYTPRIYSFTHGLVSAGSEGAHIRFDGKSIISQTISQGVSLGGQGWNGSVFVFNCNGDHHFEGDIAELLVYTGALNTQDRQTIESYLAIKYGRALDQTTPTNYYNAVGSVVWNTATNTNYNNSIFGIARDDTSALTQLQSQPSVNPVFRLNTSSLAHQQYFMLGDNAGSLTWSTSGAPTNLNILGRRWLVQKTGPTNPYTVDFSIANGAVPAWSNNLYLAVDADGDFVNGATLYQMNYNAGRYVATGLNIPHGSYVTLIAGDATVRIGDRVWIDINKNGLQDHGEPGLGSVTVTLKSCGGYTAGTQVPINYNGTTIGSSVTTDSAGSYLFNNLAPGTYYLEFTVPSTYKFTTQHVGGYGTNITINSDVSPLSAKTRCETYNYGTNDTTVDAGVITQTYSSCDSLTLSNVATVGATMYQKPGVGFTATLVGYGQNATISATNVAGVGSSNGSWRAITYSPTLSSTILGLKTISATVDGIDYKLEYYNNPAILTLTNPQCPYKLNNGVYCAQQTTVSPYKSASLDMNNSVTTIAPIVYCDASHSSWSCANPEDRPQSALVRTSNTCTQNVTIVDEAGICNSVVTDVPPADCNALVNFYNSTNGTSWSTKTNWMFNGDATWNTVCDWYGVTCAGGRVTKLNLPNNNLSGTLPSSLSALTALTDFKVGSNSNLGGTLPTTWNTMTNMQNFDISATAVGGSLPTEYSTWSNLRGFWCMSSRITGPLPSSWSTMTQLGTFHCPRPQPGYGLNGNIPSSWASMTALRNFYIEGHGMSGQIPSNVLSAWSNINNLSLYGNYFDGPLPTIIATYPSLATNGYNSTFGTNCFGTGHLNSTEQNFFETRAQGGTGTSWGNYTAYNWKYQRQCSTDIRITSATITQGDLVNGGSATYSVTINNNGSRWAYNPRVVVTLGGGLVTSTPTLTYGTLAPGASQTLTLIVTKSSVAVGTNNVTNTFVLSDSSISDSNTSNNTLTHVVSVRGSTYSICNNSALNVTIGDCEALGDLYTSTNGANWTNKTNWLTNPDVSTWWGVTITGGRVTGLGLGRYNTATGSDFYRCSDNCGNNLNGSIPASFGNLTELIYFFANNNNITSLPSTFWNLNKLQYAHLKSNPIVGSIPTTVSNMTAMYYFNFNGTQLTGPLPSELFSLPNIGYVILSDNNFNTPIPTLTYNPSLFYINLNNAGITGNPWGELVKMTNLTELHIGNNPSLTGPIPSTINNLTKLTHLNISLNAGLSNTSIPNLTIPTLQYVRANASNFSGPLPSLPSSIKNFEAQDNDFTGLLPTSWGSLSNLQYLYLWNNALEGQIPSSWANMTSLRRLGLGNNNLEGAMPVTTFQSMTSLENNPWGSMLGQNCFYNGGLNVSQISYMDTKFSYRPNNDYWGWRSQRSCSTDLEVVSVTPAGTLNGGSTITYTITYRNNGSRIAYDPKLTITLANGLQFSDSTSSSKEISLGQIAAGASSSQIVTINKLGVGSSTINYTNSFTISDTTTFDTNSANNTKTHTGTANGSAYSICLNPATTVIQSDCEALGDLYTSTNGANWTNKTNWLSSTDVDSWFGITVAGGRVTRICLNRTSEGAERCSESQGASATNANNLNGSIPASIGNLTALNYLFLSRNVGLVGSLPSTIENLDALTHLYINHTSLSLPSTGDGLNALQYLIAYNASIAGALPSWIASLPLIVQLQVQWNRITSLPDMSALNDTLRVLYVHANQISGTIPSWMGNMTNLTHFYIGYNPFTAGSIPSWICNMTNLQYVYLAGNNFNGTVPTCFNNRFPQLRMFQVHGNQLEGTPPTFSNASNLTHYYIHSNRFTGPLPSWMANIPTFRYLYADNNRFTGPIPDNFANMSTDNIIFRVSSNYLDRDTSNNAIISPALQTWWNNIVVYYNDPVNFKLIGSQGDNTSPLLGVNAKRLPVSPSFNWSGKPISQVQITGPNGLPVVATLLGGSPYHVGYDLGYGVGYGDALQEGKTYTLSFWARTISGSRTIDPSLTDNVNSGPTSQTHTIDTTWRLVSVTKTYSTIGANPRAFINIGTAGSDFYYYDPILTESTPLPTTLDTNRISVFDPVVDGSDFNSAGEQVSVGGGGSCSNLTVTPNALNSKDLPSASSEFDPNNGLIVHYNFDNNSAIDLAGGNNNGTEVSVGYDGAGRIATGAVETAAGGYIRHSTTGLSSTNGTISLWIKPTRLSSWGIWQTYDSPSTNWVDWISMFAWTDTLMYFRMGNGSTCCNQDLTVNHSLYLTLNSWNHLAFTWQGNADGVANDTMNIYINGRLVGTRTANFQSTINALARVGYGNTRDIDGTLDDFRAYNRALSAAEVVNLYNERSITISTQGNYNGCYLTVEDRAGNESNVVRLGDFTATFSPYPICNNPARTVPQSECTALMDLYTSAGGDNWTNKTNWGISPDIDSWFGITTTTIGGKQYVSKICLNSTAGGAEHCSYEGVGNNLIGSLTGSIGNFPYLQELILSNNTGLTGPIPTSIGNLTNLYHFFSTQTKLNGTLPDSMANLNNLTNLYLWDNHLSGNLPSAWGTGMANIRYINLDSNLLSGPIPESWANFADTMTSLVLSSQKGAIKLNGTLPSWLGNFTKINRVIYLHSNQFTGPIPSTLGNLTGVQHLYLGDNLLSGPIPPELGNMTNLKHLYLSNAGLTGSVPTTLSNLTNLTHLYISYNKLDRDLSNDAIIPSAITTWYNTRAVKEIFNQSDTTAPVISGNPLSGTYSFDTMSYTINMTEASAIATGGQAVIVGGGGTCSQISVIGTLTNGAGANTVTLKFATGSNATTTYNNCTLTTVDRANNTSNPINLGVFNVKLNQYPICNTTGLTISQEQCTALMDFYTNLGGNSWTNKTNWGTATTIGSWYGVTTTNSLVSYYNFDESNVNDSGPNGYNGTNNGAIFVTGKNNNGVYFDGASRRIVTVNQSVAGNNITRSAWVNREQSINSYNMFMGQYLPYAAFMSNGKIYWSLNINGIEQGITSNATLVDNTWYHITLTYNGTLLKIYINGVLDNSISVPGTITYYTNNALTIGDGQNVARYPFKGKIDDVRIYNRALSADEVEQLYLTNTMGDQTVTELNLSNNNLAGTLGTQITKLPQLRNLNFASNQNINGPLPSERSSLTDLETITCYAVGLGGNLPTSWSSLTKLNIFNCGDGLFTGKIPSSWSAMPLTYLYLHGSSLESPLPSWITTKTSLRTISLAGNNFDGPMPDFTGLPNLDGPGMLWNSTVGGNCFGTGNLTAFQVNWMNSKFAGDNTTWRGGGIYPWRYQKACTTDLQVSVTATGNVATSNGMLYTITVTNAGPRWAYSPRVAVSLQQGLQSAGTSTPTIMYSTLAPGASQTQTISVVKSASSPTTQTNAINTFTVSDPTIIDTVNNTTSHITAVKKSNISAICDHYALNTTIAECEALASLYSSTNGASWTNKTNWISSPNTDNWHGITTSLESDLVAHYTFDSSNATDDAGNEYNGILVNDPTFSPGRLGNAINLNGSNQRVNLSGSISPTNITISTWLYRTSSAVNQGIVRKQGSFALSLHQDRVQVAPGNSRSFRNTNITVPLNEWIHITWTYDGAIMRVYKNGVQEWSQALAGSIPVTANQPFIGFDDNRRWWGGQIDDVRIYSRALSDSEVANLYQTGNPRLDRITQLNFGTQTYTPAGGNNLSGTLPANLTGLTELTRFNVSDNPNLRGTIPSNFWNMTKIQSVVTSYCGLEGNLPTFGSSYPNLNAIWMSHNNFTGSLPTTWGQNTALNSISVGYSMNGVDKLSGNLPSSWGALTNLNNLGVYYANLTGSIPTTWGNMVNMINFQLQGNQLSGPLPNTLSQWIGPNQFIINNNNFTGSLSAIISGWNTSNMTHFMVHFNNFDRDSNNNAIVSSNITARVAAMGSNYRPENQGDITPPVLTFGSMMTNSDDVVEITFTLTEGSSTTGAGYLSGLTIGFTGSTACASLSTSPVNIINKGTMTIDVIGVAGIYPGCSLYVFDRANNRSNLVSLDTIVIPNYAICGVVTDITTSDCKALVDIYMSTSGSGWINKTNWMGLGDTTPTTASDWRGVTVSGNRVTSLQLSRGSDVCGWGTNSATNNMIGILPTTLGNLTGLTELCIAYNPHLTGGLPSTIGNLSALRNFVVHDNGIGGNLPASLSSLNPAQAILHNNGFTGPVPSLTGWTNLRYLYLYSNNFGGNSLPTLPTTAPNLNTVHLGHAGFSGALPPSYGLLTGLQNLYIHDNVNLSGPIPFSWGNMINLRTLYIHNNNLEGLIPSSFANLTNLNANGSYLHTNCLSSSTSYMTPGLQTILSSKFNNYTSQRSTCNNDIKTTVWNDSDNDGIHDPTETLISGVTATLKACTDQIPANTSEKLLNHELVAYYSFDTNNTTDDSGNGNNGINNGATFGAGIVANAAVFNGVNSLIQVPHNPQLSNKSNTITLSAWVKLNTLTPGGTINDRSQVITKIDNYYLTVDTSGKVSVYMYGVTDSVGYINSVTTLAINQRYHIAMTYDGQFIRIYINGVLDRQVSATGMMTDLNSYQLVIGSENGSRLLNGSIDDVRIYARTLSASEIATLYQITNPQTAVNIPIGYSGSTVTSATTTADGTATFTNRSPNKYYIEYTNIPMGYKFTTQNIGGSVNIANSDVNPWSAKTSCFELYHGTDELNVDVGLKYIPYSSCEAATPANTPILLGQPVTLSIGGYGINGQIQAITSTGVILLNQSITNQGTNWGLKTWTYTWTPTVAGTYTISGAVDGYNYKLDYYNNPALSTISCPYRTISAGNRCAVQTTVAPYSGTVLTNVNQIATIPAPVQYCNAAQISSLPCSTAGDQPSAMVVQVPNTCTSSLVVTSDVNVMCDAVTDMQPAECKALVSLYDSTAGASWTTKTNWRFLGDTTPRTACDWYGVICAGGRVTQLVLGNNNLNGTLPSLTGLNSLSYMVISLNPNLRGNLPTSWSTTLTGLNILYAGGNGFTGTLPTSWSTWSSMQQLYLDNNQLIGGLPASWSGMINLTNLVLNSNPLGGNLPTSWSTLRKLKQLGLANIQATGTLPTSWGSLTGLTELRMNANSLQGEIPTSWLNLVGLTSFSLENNQIDGPIPVGITSLSNLVASTSTDINQNCMGTSHVSGSLQLFLNAKFPSRHANQKICQTDLQLSLVSKVGNLFTGNSITYTLRYNNAGSRWSYNTILELTTDTRINVTVSGSTVGATDTGINLGIIPPGASGTITFILNKTGFTTAGVYSVNNIFTLSDTTISDTNTTNQSYADNSVQVLGSSFPICTHPSLTVPQLECESLMTIYTNMNGPNWNYKAGWNTDPNVDNWFGVDVASGRVTKVMLTQAGTSLWGTGFWTNNNVSGAIHNAITNLTKLTHIDFINKPGVGPLPDLGLLPNLVWLRCEACNLTGTISNNITNTKLQTIYLGNNSLTNIPTGLFTMNNTLRVFSIPNNPIGGSLPTGFANLTNLNTLRLDGGGFTGSIPSSRTGLVRLEELGLSNNALAQDFPTVLQSLTGLQRLYLNNSQLDGPIPSWLTGLVKLQ